MNAREQIQRDEGRVATAYKDHLGYLTIGDGILIDQRRGGGLRPEEMDFITDNRLKLYAKELVTDYPWYARLNEPRQAAMLNMRHQLGQAGLANFKKMLAALRDERWAEAEYQALDSKWAKEDTPARAKRVARQLATGNWE